MRPEYVSEIRSCRVLENDGIIWVDTDLNLLSSAQCQM